MKPSNDESLNASSQRPLCDGTFCTDCGFRSSVFANLDADQLQNLTQHRTFSIVKKGSFIARQNAPIEGFAFLRKGLAKITRTTESAREQIIGIATPNDFVGLLSVFSSSVYQYNIIAIEDCEYCMVGYDYIIHLIESNGNFSRVLLQKISQVSDTMLRTRLEISMRQLRGRVAFIICYFANEVYHSPSFSLPISRRELADLIDMRVENVVRTLSEFRRDKIIPKLSLELE
ncbi:MAG TPA: Crp/Fnr family transcriptional regulator [Salinivirgaceae bacterium]|nr:Crp/Fnr family transcriptional regulator [Salinivirgaceae bacterium]